MNPSHLPLTQAHTLLMQWLADGEHVLLVGESGSGKSTLARGAAQACGQPVIYLCADPGRPAFGPPGALSRARLEHERWEVQALEGLATMDCARFRAPLLAAIAKLMPPHSHAMVVDTPGIIRGGGALELLTGLAAITRCTRALVLGTKDHPQDVVSALRALGLDVHTVSAHPEARRPSETRRQEARQLAFKAHLGEQPRIITLSPERMLSVGELPEQDHWTDRVVALLGERGESLGLGRVVREVGSELHVEAPSGVRADQVRGLVVRDMGFQEGRLRTLRDEALTPAPRAVAKPAKPAYTQRAKPDIRIDLGSAPIKRGSSLKMKMVGGLFEDPMMVLRLDHRQRCLFFDLGEVRQIPTRIVHQTSDIFITHAHLDHFGDFPWLLRRMAGVMGSVRIFGPPELALRVEHMVHAFTWDRVEDRGPRFEVNELHGELLKRWHIQAGIEGKRSLGEHRIREDIILDEPRLRVRAVQVDHGCPVLAYAVEEPNKFDVRGNIIRERGWAAGHWLGELKTRAARGEGESMVRVACMDGSEQAHKVRALAELLLMPRTGQKIVYATDFAGHRENRDKIIALAQGADVMVCEASFSEEDREQAERTGHLCARDCAEIALAAQVKLLVPFHLSVRYEEDPALIYRQILERFQSVHIPAEIQSQL